MPTQDREFFDPLAAESDIKWEPVEGYPDGIHQKVLHQDPDGGYSRLLKFDPGVEIKRVLCHDFYEEVIILEGGLIDTRINEVFTRGEYAYRTPGMEHGPYEAPIGCLIFEKQYPE